MKILRRFIAILLITLLGSAALLGLAGCTAPAPEPERQTQAATAFFDAMNQRRFEEAYGMLAPDAKQELGSSALLSEIWGGMDASAGALVSVQGYEVQELEEGYAVKVTAEYALMTASFVIPMDASCRILSIGMVESRPNIADAPLPEGVTEQTLSVVADARYPLDATLTLPAGEGPFPVAVIVQGSGGYADRDGTVGGNKVYQQLARGLAERGVAVLRVDKRTTRYASAYQQDAEALRALTPREEYIDDAFNAVEILRADPRFSSVTVLGHGLGGVLTPRIAQEVGAERMVIMAGSPRPYHEILAEQVTAEIARIQALAGDTTKDQSVRDTYANNAESMQKMLDQFEQAMTALDQMDDAAAKNLLLPVSGTSAFYFKALDDYDAAATLDQTGKPALILQGEGDIVFSPERDFAQWKSRLGEADRFPYALYPDLNHLFMPSGGARDGSEYAIPSAIDAQVLEDIAGFITK